MDWTTLQCPACEERNQFLIASDEKRHIRLCPNCEKWMILIQEPPESGRESLIQTLDVPPTCPIDGCEEELRTDEFPTHIINEHDSNLV